MKLPYKKGNLALLFDLTAKARLSLINIFLTYIVVVTASFASPLVVRVLVDSIIGDLPFDLPAIAVNYIQAIGGRGYLREHLIFCAIAVLILAVFSNLFSYLQRISTRKTAETVAKNMRDTLFDHIQNLPFTWHIKNQTGDIIQRCISDVETVRSFLSHNVAELLRSVLMTVVALILMFTMNKTLAFVVLCMMPFMLAYSFLYHGRIGERFLKADEAEGALSAMVQENLTGVRVVRAFGKEELERNKFTKMNSEFSALWMKLGKLLSATWATGDMISGTQLVVIMISGAILASRNQITAGTFITFLTYNAMLVWPIRSVGKIIAELGKIKVSLTRVREILEAEPEEKIDGEHAFAALTGDIVFDNVSFSYEEGKPVLQNVNLTIKEGETLAILGGTGSGKTTLVHLLTRLFDLQEGGGRITIGGIDITEIDRRHLRKQIGLILQEPFLFSKSIQENLLLDQLHTNERIQEITDIAEFSETVRNLKEGLDTVIGERGVTLSGGQRQRLAIARTLIRDTKVLVFDDSLSAVDTETDAKIRQGLKNETKNTTTILIAHRVSTLMQADRILVLSSGKVEDLGTHQELLTRGNAYSRIFAMQSSMEAELGEEGE